MIVEINTQILLDNKITAHQYFIAKMIHERNFDYLETYLEVTGRIKSEDIEALVNANLLYDYNTKDSFFINRLEPRTKLKTLFLTGDFFNELMNKYPVSVKRPDGKVDRLRTNLKQCRTLYNKITEKKRTKHEHILKCLDIELTERKQNDQLKFMMRLPKWLVEEGWTTYEDQIQTKQVKQQVKYGEDII